MSIQRYWYRPNLHPFLVPLLPLSLLFGLGSRLRRWTYRAGIQKSQRFDVPVIVVGNITVGGTGKTPFVLWLAQYLKAKGKKPGIALRGFGGSNHSHHVLLVTAASDPHIAGDEAVLLASNADCPVAACIDRPAAVKKLIEAGCDIILCDDGLQHYRLARQMEIAIIDGNRHFGNGLLLPAGPLREAPARLKDVDFTIVNAPGKSQIKQPHFQMQLKPQHFVAVHEDHRRVELSQFSGKKVHALAGIGNPQRFFDALKQLNIEVIPHAFPDHHAYQAQDLDFADDYPILMTEKDAIKCKRLGFSEKVRDKQWFLRVTTEMSPEFEAALSTVIARLRSA